MHRNDLQHGVVAERCSCSPCDQARSGISSLVPAADALLSADCKNMGFLEVSLGLTD